MSERPNLGHPLPSWASGSHRRLLDMLAGWAAFADKPASEDGSSGELDLEYERECEALHDLYQEAGAMTAFDAPAIIEFLSQRIVPLLADGVPAESEGDPT